MNTKLLGGVLLIVGTAIGGGMLALPIATSQAGFIHSTLLLFACWFVMTASALLVLEVNLWLPANSNIISMAKATLGGAGQLVAWLSYLLLLYSLLAAYMAGGGDFLHNLFQIIHIQLPAWLTVVLFAGLLGFIVYLGIRSVDYVNRALMFTKLGAYILLVICILPFVSSTKLAGGEFKYITASITVAITSFGFATIVPSLRTYFNNDAIKLRKAILIGSLIPLVCYIAWDFAIMGVIPRDGSNGLVSMLHAGNSTSAFVNSLSALLQKDIITYLARIFTSICLATSFLGVSLGLSDFLADGLQVNKKGKGNIIVFSATFLPPLAIVLLDPRIFISALSYAGIYCVVLLALLPALMAWWGRYRKNIAKPDSYRVKGGKILLIFIIIVSLAMIAQGIIDAI
jgi:tyrosine-specific transport protein